MSARTLKLRKNKNDILRAIVSLQNSRNEIGITPDQLAAKLKIKKSTIVSRLFFLEDDKEIRSSGAGYTLDANAFKHISIKK